MNNKDYFRAFMNLFTIAKWKLLYHKRIKIHSYQNIKGLKIKLEHAGKITIGKRLKTREHCHIIVDGGNLELGDYCFFNYNVCVTCIDNIKIGNRVQIANNVVIVDHNHNYTQKGFVSKNVVINDNVWIGANVTILPGVTIGEGAVVAAGSVVTKDIPPHTVVAGVPAKEIKRF